MTLHNNHLPEMKKGSKVRILWCFLIVILATFIPILVVLLQDSDESASKILNYSASPHDWLYKSLHSRNYTWDATERGYPIERMTGERYADYRPESAPEHYLAQLRQFHIDVCPAHKRDARSSKGLSTFAIVFGQFVDHDVILTHPIKDDAGLEYEIAVPVDDPVCGSRAAPMKIQAVQRDTSVGSNENGYRPRDSRTTSAVDYVREALQVNFVTAELDLSVVYGSTPDFAQRYLREDGGRYCELATGARDTLPLNTYESVEMANENNDPNVRMLLAGDVRANEQWGLLAFQTWWVQLHNIRCHEVRSSEHIKAFCASYESRELFGDDLETCYYTVARVQQIAVYQKIIYEEFLPAVLGKNNARKAQCDAKPVEDYVARTPMFGEMGAQLYRLHNMIPNDIVFADSALRETRRGKLCDAFFDPREFVTGEINFKHIVAGAITEPAMEMNECMVECLGGKLFGDHHCLDLGSLNMARYYIEDISSMPEVREKLNIKPSLDARCEHVSSDKAFCDTVEDHFGYKLSEAPLWILACAEDKASGSALGESMTRATVKQFSEFCAHDMFYYKRIHPSLLPSKSELEASSTMAELLYKSGVVDAQYARHNPFFHK